MGGLGDGASARWRSLHELAVVSGVLGKSDSEIAERYRDYGHIERWKDVREYQKHASALGRLAFTDEEVNAVRDAAGAVELRWGRHLFGFLGVPMGLFLVWTSIVAVLLVRR
jgi:hypothetical protein